MFASGVPPVPVTVPLSAFVAVAGITCGTAVLADMPACGEQPVPGPFEVSAGVGHKVGLGVAPVPGPGVGATFGGIVGPGVVPTA